MLPLVFIILFVVSVVLLLIFDNIQILFMVGITFIFALASVCTTIDTRMETATYPEERQALQEVYTNSKDILKIETSQYAEDVAEFNEKLVKAQHWNQSIWFDWYYSDRIMKVEPIK